MNTLLSCSLPHEAVARIEALAERLGASRSAAMRAAIEAGLAALDGGGPLPKVEGRRTQEIEMLEKIFTTIVKNDERYAKALLKIYDDIKVVRQSMEGK